MGSGDVTLTAVWTTNSYVVTYDSQGGSSVANGSYSTGGSFALASAPTRSGYIFNGWFAASSGGSSLTSPYAPGTTSDITLYAQWTLVPTISTVAAVTGSSGPLPGTNTVTLTGTGYTGTTSVTIDGQACTNIVVTGDNQITCTVPAGISVGPKDVVITAPGGTVTSVGGYTYFATVTFTANTGAGSMSNQTGDAATALSANAFTKVGSLFDGWSTTPNGVVVYADGASFPFVSDQILYAHWTLIPIVSTVVFNSNGGAGSMAPEQGVIAAPLTPNSFTRANYTFGGWTTSADGTGTSYGNGASYPFDQNITLFAKWIADKHTISFNGNKPTDGTSPAPVGPVDFGSTIKAPGNTGTLTKDGYSFGGWNTSPDGTGTDYPVGSDIPVGGDITLYAKWIELPKHTVLFTGNGSTAGLSAAEISYRPANLVPNGFTRDGYKFAGWSTSPDGAGTFYADGALYAFDEDLTLYAQWTQNQSTTPTPGTNPGPIVTEGTDDVKATEDGVDDPVVVTILNGGTGIRVSTKTWKIGIQSDKKVVEGIQVPSKLKVYLIRGVNATTDGDGFMPGTIANVYLYSTRIFLGKALVRPDGTFAATFPVSAKTTLGHHVMQVEGTSYDGKFRTAAVGLTVIDLPLGKQVPISMIFYDLNVSDLNATNRAKLDTVAAKQIAGHYRKIWIFGYTDIQTGVDNQALSAARAKKVTEYLHKKLPKVQVVFKYFGPASPRNPAHTQAAYAQNRRSEILGQR